MPDPIRPAKLGCQTLERLDIRGTQMKLNVAALLNSLTPLRPAAGGVAAAVPFEHIDTRLAVQAVGAPPLGL